MGSPSSNPAQETSILWRARRMAWLLLAVTFSVRLAALAVGWQSLKADPDGYRSLATNLAERGTLGFGEAPSAYRPPLYPLMLAIGACKQGWGTPYIATLHLLLGTATVALVVWLGRHFGLRNWALMAGFLVAIDPILVHQSTLVMTETAAAFLAALALAALVRMDSHRTARSAAVAGGCLALASLCRPTFLAMAAVVALSMAWFWIRRRSGERLGRLASFLVGCGLVLLPWAGRNYLQFGRPIATTTHGGYTLLLGNNPSFYAWLREAPWGDVWEASELAPVKSNTESAAGASETQLDRQCYDQARSNIQREPLMFAYASLTRLGRLWGVLPHRISPNESLVHRMLRWCTAVWYAGEFALALIGLWYLGRRALAPPWLFVVLLAASFSLVHLLYWTDMRMRAPLMVAVSLAAALGLASAAGRGVGRPA